jgi:uncharacterized protein (DUF983 family)
MSVHYDKCPHCGGEVPVFPARDLLKIVVAVVGIVAVIAGCLAIKVRDAYDSDSTKSSSASANTPASSP